MLLQTTQHNTSTSPAASPRPTIFRRMLLRVKERMPTRLSPFAQNPLVEKPMPQENTREPSAATVARVDKAAIISYYVVVGSTIDILSGLAASGILVARSVSVAANSTVLGKWYRLWREQVYRSFGTTQESSKTKKYLTELAAYIPFRAPVYALSNLVGNLVQEGSIDFKKALIGTLFFIAYAPAAAPILNGW